MARIEVLERVRRGKKERRCNRCKMWWPRDRFEKNQACLGGLTGECRLCRAERRARDAAKQKAVDDDQAEAAEG